ncbi:hypothetical protein HPP92_022524 [Vanilla planifolia]|uniref:Protein kinase domain-containing protein n=1 Tax=Vanilla planifolia TaxID=51239 RepID=A0A835PSC2_VANPL|nr:hypothetical protein HPP92_022524 [Vanilla planifolia]
MATRFFAWSLLVLFHAVSRASALTADGLSLLALKAAVSLDPNGALDSWRDSDAEPCNWSGVACRAGRVTAVSLANLSLEGYLPSELSLLTELETLTLPRNRFSGQIPTAIGAIRSLIYLDLSNNNFSGKVPSEIGALDSLVHLDLSSNYLSGSLPPEIAALPRLAGVLNLSCNFFSGRIPPVYGDIPVAVSLDLQQNQLSGQIPQVGSLLNQGPTAFANNPDLCGFPLKNPCDENSKNGESQLPLANSSFNLRSPAPHEMGGVSRRKSGVTIPILAGIIVTALCSVFVLQWQLRRRRRDNKLGGKGKPLCGSPEWNAKQEVQQGEGILVAVDENFNLELEDLLRASAYVIGKSRSGIVYKVVVASGPALAVRRMSDLDDVDYCGDELCLRRAFEAEATAIGRARHPNVVQLRAYYYASDEKLLIYDYIPNGNLHSALHGGQTSMPWAARLAILVGAARGLAYLHECSTRKWPHGKLKSSKILLGEDLRPFVSGFGIDRVQRNGGGMQKQGRLTMERAAAGYLAPEMRHVEAEPATQRGMYAFGVLMMETATGRVADAGLEEWVRSAFREARPLSEVVDPALLKEVHAKRQVLAVFHIALGCTEWNPESRPRMRTVADSLERVGPAS